ncbi:MAG: DUF2267 domain-containing protein [Methylococcaceae bacterium]
MKYEDFLGQVQHQARLASLEEAVRAIRATLETFGERLYGGSADNLAAQLPMEIGHFLRTPPYHGRFTLEDFYQRVAEREGRGLSDAIFHARVVLNVMEVAVDSGEMKKIRAQLPHEWDSLMGNPHSA